MGNRMMPPVCTFAWIVNRQVRTIFPEDETVSLNGVLIQNEGCTVMGRFIYKPRTGWYDQVVDSTFSSLQVEPTLETNYPTIMSMESYGPNFAHKGAELSVT
jgi:hypothetical protein